MKDTLQELSNPETMVINSSNERDRGAQPETISSAIVIAVELEGLRTQKGQGLESTQFAEVKVDDILEPGSYAEAIACDQHLCWKNTMKEEFAS